jgi:4-hydroxybenzoate polyprenyltransferase
MDWLAGETVATAPRSAGRAALKAYAHALRVHQWLKNLLLFVPMLGAHHLDARSFGHCALGFASFSLCASGVYVINDLVDLGRDRQHPNKRRRPFAAGTLPVARGRAMVPLLLGAALLLAPFASAAFSAKFVAVLAGYVAIAVAYSLWLKRLMMVDIVVLACLYGLRLLAGGAAAGVPLSPWLALFALFLFTMLATVKRCTELAGRLAAGTGDPAGRGYRLGDLPLLEAFAAASGLTAILVLALYANSEAVSALYVHPKWMAGLCVVTVYWVGRVLLLAHRGEMRDDPVVFAATDRASLGCAALAGGVILAASL